jgi:hypothetical protein
VLLDERAVVLPIDGVGTENDERLGSELSDQRRIAPQAVGGALLKALPIVAAKPRLQDQQRG